MRCVLYAMVTLGGLWHASAQAQQKCDADLKVRAGDPLYAHLTVDRTDDGQALVSYSTLKSRFDP